MLHYNKSFVEEYGMLVGLLSVLITGGIYIVLTRDNTVLLPAKTGIDASIMDKANAIVSALKPAEPPSIIQPVAPSNNPLGNFQLPSIPNPFENFSNPVNTVDPSDNRRVQRYPVDCPVVINGYSQYVCVPPCGYLGQANGNQCSYDGYTWRKPEYVNSQTLQNY
jgi:hypothetical protein